MKRFRSKEIQRRLDERLDKERSRSGPSISEVNEQIAPDTRRRSLTLGKSTEFRKPGDRKRPNKRRLDTPARPVPLHRSLTTTRDEIRSRIYRETLEIYRGDGKVFKFHVGSFLPISRVISKQILLRIYNKIREIFYRALWLANPWIFSLLSDDQIDLNRFCSLEYLLEIWFGICLKSTFNLDLSSKCKLNLKFFKFWNLHCL